MAHPQQIRSEPPADLKSRPWHLPEDEAIRMEITQHMCV